MRNDDSTTSRSDYQDMTPEERAIFNNGKAAAEEELQAKMNEFQEQQNNEVVQQAIAFAAGDPRFKDSAEKLAYDLGIGIQEVDDKVSLIRPSESEDSEFDELFTTEKRELTPEQLGELRDVARRMGKAGEELAQRVEHDYLSKLSQEVLL